MLRTLARTTWIFLLLASPVLVPAFHAHAADECPEEENGGHCDDKFPVMQPTSYPPVPAKLPGCTKEIFEAGYRDGVGGQRWQVYEHCRVRIPTSRKGCQAYRKTEPSFDDVDALKCCEQGFAKGMDDLFGHITKGGYDVRGDRYEDCRTALQLGAEVGRGFCAKVESLGGDDNACLPPYNQRYLGCYMTGFNAATVSCMSMRSAALRNYYAEHDMSKISAYTIVRETFNPIRMINGPGLKFKLAPTVLPETAPAQ